jgi:hypothetical protein
MKGVASSRFVVKIWNEKRYSEGQDLPGPARRRHVGGWARD